MLPKPLDAGFCRQYLKQHCDDVQLHFTSAVAIAPGECTDLASRSGYLGRLFTPKGRTSLQHDLGGHTVYKANGATQVVPGSHLWDKARQPSPMRSRMRK